MDLKEVLEIAIIPLAAAVLPFVWTEASAWLKRRQFRELILRELEEVGPHPPNKVEGGRWTDHHPARRFIHPTIFERPTENRDFILSLPADLTYYVTQLWNSKENADQWLYMLQQVEKSVPWWQPGRRKELAKVRERWSSLIREYDH